MESQGLSFVVSQKDELVSGNPKETHGKLQEKRRKWKTIGERKCERRRQTVRVKHRLMSLMSI